MGDSATRRQIHPEPGDAGDYEPPVISDIDAADDREFRVVGGVVGSDTGVDRN